MTSAGIRPCDARAHDQGHADNRSIGKTPIGRIDMRLLSPIVLAMTIMPLALAPQASAQEDSTGHMVTYVEVAPAAKAQAASLLKELAAASKQDAGLLRFEILERTAPSNQFVIIE